MPALLNFVKESKEAQICSISIAKSSLERGELPENYTAINMDTYSGKNINLKHPQNNVDIRDESGKTIATYHKSIDKWVLSKGISPDEISRIGGKETISSQQYEYMAVRAAHANYVSPGYAIIQAQSDLRAQMSMSIKFGADIDDYGYMDTSDLDTMMIDKKAAIASHRRLPEAVRNILGNHEQNFRSSELYDYATKQGTNVVKFQREGKLVYSTEDVMAFMYKGIHRIPELEGKLEDRALTTDNTSKATPEYNYDDFDK